MAAGAYKGLTIQIGGDASKLTTALRGVNSAAHKTQQELNRLNKASKLDPGNSQVAVQQIGAIASQSVIATEKVSMLQKGITELSRQGVRSVKSGGTIAQLAKETDVATLAIEKARAAYTKAGADINRVYREIEKATKGEVRIRDITDTGKFNQQYLDNLRDTGKITNEQHAAIMKLKPAWESARAALDDYADVAQLEHMQNELAEQEAQFNNLLRSLAQVDKYKSFPELGKQLKEVNDQLVLVSAASETVDDRLGSLQSALALDPGNMLTVSEYAKTLDESIQMADMQAGLLQQRLAAYQSTGIDKIAADMGNVALEVGQSEKAFHTAKRALDEFAQTGDTTSNEYKKLEAAVAEALKRMDTAHAVQQYQNLSAQLAKVQSDAERASQGFIKLSDPSFFSLDGKMRTLSEEINFIGDALRTAQSDASGFSDALKINPDNVEVAVAQFGLLSEAEKLVNEEAERLQKKLASFDVEAIKAATNKDVSAAQQIIDAKNAYDEATESVREYNNAISEYQAKIDKAQEAGNTKAVEDYTTALNMLEEELVDVKQTQEDAFQQVELSKQRKDLNETQVAIAKNSAEADKLHVAMKKVSETDVTPKFDTSFAEQLKSAFEYVNSGNVFGMQSEATVLGAKAMSAAIENVSDRYKRLSEVAESFREHDDAFEMTELQTKELNNALSLTTENMVSLKAQMDAIPKDKLNFEAIKNGTVAADLVKTEDAFKRTSEQVKAYEDTIKELENILDGIESKDIMSEEDTQNAANLHAQIYQLNEVLKDFKSSADTALANFTVAKATAEFNELTVKEREAAAEADRLAWEFVKLNSKSNIGNAVAGANAQIKALGGAVDDASSRFKRLDAVAKLSPTGVTTFMTRVRTLAEVITTTREKSELLRRNLDEYRAAGIDKISTSFGNVATKVATAEKRVHDAKLALENMKNSSDATEQEIRQLEAALADAMKEANTAHAVQEFRELEIQAKETDTAIEGLMNNGTGGVGAAAVQAAVAVGNVTQQYSHKVIDSSNEIDAAYRDMRKTVNGTEEQYEKLYRAAMKYSQTHVTSADTMLEMEALAGQVGISAEALQNFSEVAANLDVATDIDAEEIALKMGQIVNVMSDLDENNVQGFADALVGLGNNMPAQESAIMQISQRLSSIGDVAGFTTPQILGWAAAIASTGQRSEAAATGVSNIITTMQSAVSNGGDELEKFAKAAGMTSEQFKEAWGKDASGVLRDFIGKLQDMGPDAIKQLEDLGIEGVRSTQTLLSLAKTVENVDKAMDISQGAWDRYANGNPVDGLGEVAQEAARKAEGFSGSLQKMKNSAQVFGAALGDALIPYMDKAAGFLQNLTDILNNLDDSTKDNIVRFGALATGIAVVYPIVSSLGGAFATLLGSISGFAVKGIAPLISNGGIIASIASGFETLQIGAMLAADAIGAFVTSGALLTTVAAGAAVVLGGALLVGLIKYVAKSVEAKKHSERFHAAISDISESTSNLAHDLELGAKGVEGYGDAWDNAGTGLEELVSTMEAHNKANKETREESMYSIAMLEKYRDIIDKAAGAGDDFAGSEAKVKWAVDGLNAMLGTNYDYLAVIDGTYQDAEGATKSYREEIEKLIDAKKREIELQAYGDIYAENVKAAYDAERALEKAEATRKKVSDDYVKQHAGENRYSVNGEGNVKSHEVTEQELRIEVTSTKEYREANQLVGETQQAVEATNEELERSKRLYDGQITAYANATSSKDMGNREKFLQTSADLQMVREELGMTSDDFDAFAKTVSYRLLQCGVSADELANMDMKQLAKSFRDSGGDVQQFIEDIVNLNAQEFEDKYMGIHFDEEGNLLDAENRIVEWNEKTQQFEPVKLEADSTQLDNALQIALGALDLLPDGVNLNMGVTGASESKEEIDAVSDSTKSVPKKTNPEVKEKGAKESTTNVNNLSKAIGGVSGKQVTVTATAVGTQAVKDLASYINNLKDKAITITQKYKQTGKPANAGESAAGAYIPYNKIPRHAAGIFTRPTLTNIGWVGEDGAELYSGNSLIPLTNRKYSMPYIDDISDAVARKLGGSGVTYNTYINDAVVNDDAEVQAAVINLLSTLQRKGAMNRG